MKFIAKQFLRKIDFTRLSIYSHCINFYKTLFCVFLLSFCYGSDSKETYYLIIPLTVIIGNHELPQHDSNTKQNKQDSLDNLSQKNAQALQSPTKQFKKPQATCQKNWHIQECKGNFICYATKCYYTDTNIQELMRATIATHIQKLQNHTNERLPANNNASILITHLEKLMDSFQPNITTKQEIKFQDRDKNPCYFSLWQKDSKNLLLNLTGCHTNSSILYSFTQAKRGVIELYHYTAY